MGDFNVEDVESRALTMLKRPVPARHMDQSQKYCVLSVVAPEGTNQKCPEMAIRIHGCRPTMADANAWAKALRDSNDFFDVFVCTTNEWVPLPPNLKDVGEISYTDKRVQDIHTSWVEHLKGTKADMIERLEDLQVIKDEEEKKNGGKKAGKKGKKKGKKTGKSLDLLTGNNTASPVAAEPEAEPEAEAEAAVSEDEAEEEEDEEEEAGVSESKQSDVVL
jgi:Family of unknown function (DUF5832)